jgi:hypothetical protein
MLRIACFFLLLFTSRPRLARINSPESGAHTGS